jgi:hypothetical protein
VDFIEIAVADDQVTPEPFKRGRIGIEHLVTYQVKPGFQR